METREGRDWMDDLYEEEMAGPPPENVMVAVWHLERLFGRCDVAYAEWRSGLASERWARRLSDPSAEGDRAEGGKPWTAG